MNQIRTIQKAVDEIKEVDPNTSINYSLLSRLVEEGKIPSIKIGKRKLVDMASVKKYFELGTQNDI